MLPRYVAGFTQQKLALSGHEIFANFGVKGAGVGRFKQHASEAVVEGRVENDPAAILAFLKAEVDAGRLGV